MITVLKLRPGSCTSDTSSTALTNFKTSVSSVNNLKSGPCSSTTPETTISESTNDPAKCRSTWPSASFCLPAPTR